MVWNPDGINLLIAVSIIPITLLLAWLFSLGGDMGPEREWYDNEK